MLCLMNNLKQKINLFDVTGSWNSDKFHNIFLFSVYKHFRIFSDKILKYSRDGYGYIFLKNPTNLFYSKI